MDTSFKELNRVKQRKFLRCYARIGNITGASAASGVSSSAHYHWIRNDPRYIAAFELAKDIAVDGLEEIALERAKKSSDLLMIFMLKALRPDKYREQRMVMGDPNSPVQHEMRIVVDRTDSSNRQTYLPARPALGPGEDSE